MTSHARLAALLLTLATLCAPAALAQPGHALNCADPLFQAEMNMCAETDFNAAEVEMTAAYDAGIAQFRDQDAAFADEGPDYVGAEKLLAAAQRSWAINRDDFCGARSLTFFGGSMRPTVHFACLAMLTRSRTEELRWLLD